MIYRVHVIEYLANKKMSYLQENNDFLGFSLCKKDNGNVKNCIGYFLLELYHRACFGYDGYIDKNKIRYEFQAYIRRNDLLKSPELQERIGALLQRNGFLKHTERGSDRFQIRMTEFREFYNNVLKQIDEAQIQSSTSQITPKIISEGKQIQNIEINLNDDECTLEYQRGTLSPIKHDFYLTSTGCFICQKNFSTEKEFDDHIEYHGEASGFQSILNYSLTSNADFKLSYQTCENKYLLRFTLRTHKNDLIVEKIVIVRPRRMCYARKEDGPFEMSPSGIEYFFVDSHLFNVGIPQPIVIIYRHKNQNSLRNVAQYLFVRHEEFPIVNMKLKSTRVISRDEMKKPRPLPEYYPSTELKKHFNKGDDLKDEEIGLLFPEIRQYLEDNKELRSTNICQVYKVLLEIEDIMTSNKYEKLSRSDCEIKGYCGEYSIMLKNVSTNINVAETLNPFDEIILVPHKNVNDNNNDENNKDKKGKGKTIRGYVYRVYGTKVCFKPRDRKDQQSRPIQLHHKYDVSFAPGRIPIIFQYHALQLLKKEEHLRKFLFPIVNFIKTPSQLSLEFYNQNIKINPEQMQAVRNIADAPNNAFPYIIFGPPGTGKTTTVVESIYQLWRKDEENKILVTAGSNSACDEVARKLCEIFTKIDPEGLNLLRIYAAAVEKRIDNIDEDLLEASNLCHNYHFYPSIESISSYRVVVATLTVVGRLVQAKLGEDCFTHVFIDECAASTEPEALVGIVGVLSPKARLILSGDPKQLGPILQSQKAANLGLKQSLMERLLKRKCYEVDPRTGDYDRSIQTRLVRNFRTHSDILKLSNLLYYQGELIPCAKSEITDWALGWHRLPRKNFPIIFNVVYGKTEKDKESTSLCNFKELSVVLDYVKNLIFFGIDKRKITENDIGIISPYKKQCNLLREELDKRGWYKIETGSVETFQGKEKPIIVISMVRSNVPGIGFLDNPKRLNVTLTRAQALMVIVGNPETLEKFNDWKEVIEYCIENRALTGAKYPRERLQQSNFKTSQSSLSTISNVQQQHHQKHDNKSESEQKNNHRRRQRHGNRRQSNIRENKSKRNEISDCISLSSNLEEKVDDWLKVTAMFREKHSTENVPSSTKSSVYDDFEIVNKLKPSSDDRFEIIQSQNKVQEGLKYTTSALDTEIKDLNQKISKEIHTKPSTSNQAARNQILLPQKKTVHINRDEIFPKSISHQETKSAMKPLGFSEENNHASANRAAIPKQIIKPLTTVRPMPVSENSNNSLDQGMSSLYINQTASTSSSNRPIQSFSNRQAIPTQDFPRFPANDQRMSTNSPNIHNPVLQNRNYSMAPNYDTQRVHLKEQKEKKSCTIS